MTLCSRQRPLNILALMHEALVPPETTEGLSEKQIQPWKMEYDVTVTLEQTLGHRVTCLGLYGDLRPLAEALDAQKPDLVFNMMEEFDGCGAWDQHLVAYLELRSQRYTGCNPRGLTLARDKALSKKLLDYDGVPVPRFEVFEKPVTHCQQAARLIKGATALPLPLIVKSLSEEGSVGLSRRSVVKSEAALARRVAQIHTLTGGAAIAEEFIEGREIYVGVLGKGRQLQTSVPLELQFKKLPLGAPNIATSRLKWDYAHQRELGVATRPAQLSRAQTRELVRLAKHVYRALSLSGYARLDFRLSAHDGRFYLLEANPNPSLAYGEDFAEGWELAGLDYPTLLTHILRLGLRA